MCLRAPPPLHPTPLWADPASPGSLDIPERPTPLAQEVGSPEGAENQGWSQWRGVGGETERMEYPLFPLKQEFRVCDDMMTGTLGRGEPRSRCHCPTSS